MSGRRWLVVDLLLVAVFAVIGRLSHYGTLTAGGWWTTAWPFLAGTLLAWAALVARGDQPPPRASDPLRSASAGSAAGVRERRTDVVGGREKGGFCINVVSRSQGCRDRPQGQSGRLLA